MKGFISYFLLLVFGVLNALDAHSTWLVLKPNRYRQERNPFARMIMKKFGVKRGIVIIKVGILIPFIIFVTQYLKDDIKGFRAVFAIADAIFSLVVANNYRIYHKERKRRVG